MRWLIEYIRSCFCKHDWELIIDGYVFPAIKEQRVKVYRCKKCGHSKRYKEISYWM